MKYLLVILLVGCSKYNVYEVELPILGENIKFCKEYPLNLNDLKFRLTEKHTGDYVKHYVYTCNGDTISELSEEANGQAIEVNTYYEL